MATIPLTAAGITRVTSEVSGDTERQLGKKSGSPCTFAAALTLGVLRSRGLRSFATPCHGRGNSI